LFSIEALLNETPLRSPGFSMGGEKTFAQEVAHSLYLNIRFLVILRIGLQHVLNDGGIGRDDGFFQTTQIEFERIAEEFGVPGQNLYGIADHGERIRKGAGPGNDRYL
jgi:hypothetical protein